MWAEDGLECVKGHERHKTSRHDAGQGPEAVVVAAEKTLLGRVVAAAQHDVDNCQEEGAAELIRHIHHRRRRAVVADGHLVQDELLSAHGDGWLGEEEEHGEDDDIPDAVLWPHKGPWNEHADAESVSGDDGHLRLSLLHQAVSNAASKDGCERGREEVAGGEDGAVVQRVQAGLRGNVEPSHPRAARHCKSGQRHHDPAVEEDVGGQHRVSHLLLDEGERNE